MSPTARFPIFILVSVVAFIGLICFALRKRGAPPPTLRLVLVTAIVVVGGMVFAKNGHNFGLPWWIYYTVPALLTLCLPPVVFRMNKPEATSYLRLSFLLSPLIHALFSLFLGWKEYMPFIPVPSIAELLG